MEINKTTKQKICPNCGEHLTPEQDVCPVCGLGYAAYMEVKSNPKAELAKLYELVESYDGWSTPEEKKERRREKRRKERRGRREDILIGIISVVFIIMLICAFGLIPEASFWVKVVGWIIIGGGGGIGAIMLFILAIGGIGHGIIVLTDRNKEIAKVTKVKQRIKEIEATGVTYNYQRPKPKEEAKTELTLKREEPLAGEYKGKVNFEKKNNKKKKEMEECILRIVYSIICILHILFTAFILKKMDSKLDVFTNSLTGEVKLFGWFYMCWEDISILLILISLAINIGIILSLPISYIRNKLYLSTIIALILTIMSFLILGMVYGGGSVREETFIRWYWLYVAINSSIQGINSAIAVDKS